LENNHLACRVNFLIAGALSQLKHGAGGKVSQNNQPEMKTTNLNQHSMADMSSCANMYV